MSLKYGDFVEISKKIEETGERLKITQHLVDLFKKASKEDVEKIVYLLQGMVAPEYDGLEVGVGERFVVEAIRKATGYSTKEIDELYAQLGDLGLVAEKLLEKKKQTSLFSQTLTVEKVFDTFKKMAQLGGQGSQETKIRYLAELLNNAKPLEAVYITRFPLGRLRMGVGSPTILDALSVYEVGDKSLREEIERAYTLCSDLGLVTKTLFEKGISGVKKFRIQVGKPLLPSLAERLGSAKEIIKKLGKCSVEAKYDGFRLQVHKNKQSVEIFSRRLEKMTRMFPEITEGVRKQIRAKTAILEGEALAYNEKLQEFYPFQFTIQRKRKYGVKEKSKEFPLKLFVFEILYCDGKDLTQKPYSERRKKLSSIIEEGDTIKLADNIVTSSAKELKKYFDKSVSLGLEGIIAKDLKAPYVAGARKFSWIKLKRSYRGELADTVDLVILGYYKGKGLRTKFGIGGLLAGVYDPDEEVYKTVARIGSGFSEEQLVEIKKALDETRLEKKPPRVKSLVDADVWVEPKYVATVAADEITKSPMHTCGKTKDTGYALRFPRMVSELRSDKRPEDATTVDEIISIYKLQGRVRQSKQGGGKNA